jgi:uncharacterized protein (TIGR02300 family)
MRVACSSRRQGPISTLTAKEARYNGGAFFNPQEQWAVAKPELGTKRVCANCGTKFYDLARDPIVCPKCGTVFEVAAMPTRAAAKAAPVAAPVVAEEVEPAQPAGAEVISLEEAAEAESKAGAAKPAAPGLEGEEEEVEIAAEAEDDTTFLEQDEEESSDVSDLIGEGIEEKEEEN